jgi:hypothetical protein
MGIVEGPFQNISSLFKDEEEDYSDWYTGDIYRLFVQQADFRQEATFAFDGSIAALLSEGSPVGRMAMPSIAGDTGESHWEIDFSLMPYPSGSIYSDVLARNNWVYSGAILKTYTFVYGDDLTMWDDLGVTVGTVCHYLLPE